MMLNQRMEIKVALLGNVSAGKTTVLNAILQNKYGEVAKKRTTAGANYFYLNVVTKDDVVKDTKEEHHLADSIHQEITKDNKNKVRDGHEITKKVFDIEVPQSIVRCRKDTVLVLVDIPGINEAGTESKYKNFVSNNWKSFDCVIVVMDGKQGVNTEDQVFLLQFVKENLSKKKNIPVIILCNKVDDPMEEEQVELAAEARNEVHKIFKVKCRETSLRSVLEKNEQKVQKFEVNMTPAFLTISAGNAFIYRCGSQMTLEQFRNFDKAIIDSFGRNQLGQKAWNRLSPDKRIEKVFSIVSDQDQYAEGIKECNFDAFMNVLDMFVGGEDRQTCLIQEQIELSLLSVYSKPFMVGKITQGVRTAFMNLSALGTLKSFGGIESLQKSFWKSHEKYEKSSWKQFKDAWPNQKQKVNVLIGPIKELGLYFDLISELKWESEKKKILLHGEKWVHQYFEFLLEKNSDMDHEISKNDIATTNSSDINREGSKNDIATENIITPYDWFLIMDSILLLSYNKYFCEIFGQVKSEFSIRLQIALRKIKTTTMSMTSCPACSGDLLGVGMSTGKVCDLCCVVYVDEIPILCAICDANSRCPRKGRKPTYNALTKIFSCCDCYTYCVQNTLVSLKRKYGTINDLVPSQPDIHKRWTHVSIPKSLHDENHFGHVPFEFCQLVKRMRVDKNEFK